MLTCLLDCLIEKVVVVEFSQMIVCVLFLQKVRDCDAKKYAREKERRNRFLNDAFCPCQASAGLPFGFPIHVNYVLYATIVLSRKHAVQLGEVVFLLLPVSALGF